MVCTLSGTHWQQASKLSALQCFELTRNINWMINTVIIIIIIIIIIAIEKKKFAQHGASRRHVS